MWKRPTTHDSTPDQAATQHNSPSTRILPPFHIGDKHSHAHPPINRAVSGI